MIDFVITNSLSGILSLISFAVMVACLVPLVFGKNKTHFRDAVVAFGIFSLAMMANNVFAYVVSIFIFASKFTSVDFLQNIAAIFKGDSKYFDYKIRSMSESEKMKNFGSRPDLASGDIDQADFEESEQVENEAMQIDELKGEYTNTHTLNQSSNGPPADETTDETDHDHDTPIINHQDKIASEKSYTKTLKAKPSANKSWSKVARSYFNKAKSHIDIADHNLRHLALDWTAKQYPLWEMQKYCAVTRGDKTIYIEGILKSPNNRKDILLKTLDLTEADMIIDANLTLVAIYKVIKSSNRLLDHYELATGRRARVVVVYIINSSRRDFRELITKSNYNHQPELDYLVIQKSRIVDSLAGSN